MRRFKQQMDEAECLEVLNQAKRGVLSVIGDDGWPYGIWLNPHLENGRIYFHAAKEGHKIDAIGRDSRVSFTVIDEGRLDEDDGWSFRFRSVVVFGRIRPVEDHSRAIELCRNLARRFNPSEEDIEDEIRRAAARVQMLELVPEHITGKRVHEK